MEIMSALETANAVEKMFSNNFETEQSISDLFTIRVEGKRESLETMVDKDVLDLTNELAGLDEVKDAARIHEIKETIKAKRTRQEARALRYNRISRSY